MSPGYENCSGPMIQHYCHGATIFTHPIAVRTLFNLIKIKLKTPFRLSDRLKGISLSKQFVYIMIPHKSLVSVCCHLYFGTGGNSYECGSCGEQFLSKTLVIRHQDSNCGTIKQEGEEDKKKKKSNEMAGYCDICLTQFGSEQG